MPAIRIACALFLLLTISSIVSAQATPAICSVTPPPGSPSLLYKDGTSLCWNGKPLRMVGYGTTDLATRDGYDYARFLNTIRFVDNTVPVKRHGVNLTRIWALGDANNPDCFHTPADNDPSQPPMTMPFQLMPGQSCNKNHLYPKYNLCVSNVACNNAVGFNPAYANRLKDILKEARKNGILVELVLFDAYFLGRQHDANALYATNPWNPLNNNMDQNVFRRFPGSATFAACTKLYRSTDPSDTTDDSFPEFYDICSDTSSSAGCNKTLNCLGLIQKSYVESMVDLVRNNTGGSDHVFFEIMNRATFDKIDSRKEGFDLNKFKRWNDEVGYWIKCHGDGHCGNTKGDYLVLGEVGLAEYRDLACTNRALCPNNPLDTLAMPNIDIINIQGYTWRNSPGAPDNPCVTALTAINKFKKPVIIDTDSAYERSNKCQVARWASEISSCGQAGEAHFNQLDGMTFGYPEPKMCSFTGVGGQAITRDFDERYLDCHTLDTIAAGDPTYLSNIVTTEAPASCPDSVNSAGQPIWCASACK
ncbi:MAG TPA: hypothetical protein VFG11_11740 [Acidobacteriota bacterium]|nr:hypothetical protein [Acidobacteriota bacterium]